MLRKPRWWRNWQMELMHYLEKRKFIKKKYLEKRKCHFPRIPTVSRHGYSQCIVQTSVQTDIVIRIWHPTFFFFIFSVWRGGKFCRRKGEK